MKADLLRFMRKKHIVVPVFLLVLVLAIAACGSDPTSAPAVTQPTATSQAEDAMAKDAEMMADDSMAKDAEMMADDSMANDAEKMADDSMAKDAEKMEGEAMMESGPSLRLELSGFEALANGYHYEGWAIIDGNPVSTGKFNIGPSGELVALDGTAKSGGVFHAKAGLESASAVVITIEPPGDADDIPAATHYISGSVSNGTAALSVGHAAALGDDFSTAAGVYILATPTDGAGNNENSGIWFLDLSTGNPSVGLELPVLPEGWVYEGWVVIDGVPVSTGRFTALDAVDLNDPYSGTEGGPPFPGEDFLNDAPAGLVFPTDLAGAAAVISVEPSPDDSAGPFTLKPLIGAISVDSVDHQTYQLDSGVSNFPFGTATIGEF